jgi:uncharacterized protein
LLFQTDGTDVLVKNQTWLRFFEFFCWNFWKSVMIVDNIASERFRAFFECLETDDTDQSLVVADYLLVKLAARCNLACTYCYWFKDESVMNASKVLTLGAEDAFVERLSEHITRHRLSSFFILFHGGEPTLFGKVRFDNLCCKLRRVETELNLKLRLSITTNAVLVDSSWAELFLKWRVGVTVSIDGPKQVHDLRRVGFHGEGSFDLVLRGIHALRNLGIEPGFLSVCDPKTDARAQLRFFAEDLGASSFDILVPDATNDDAVESISQFYIALFDAWWDEWMDRGVEVRFLQTLVRGLLGEESQIESIGFGPNTTCTLTTDGSLEPLDVLRVAGKEFTRTKINVFQDSLQSIQNDPLWREVLRASLTLPSGCKTCRYKNTCGGGHVGQRWSTARRFDNPTVYCEDIKAILGHIGGRLFSELSVTVPRTALSELGSLR